ncbi:MULTISPECIES: ABC transporter ATP-binding protein [Halococcus]|uniref:ABC transporter n=1 Tax=Halococcus salifodinae DSM 8989 TaxID=1227456 RepID=M0NFV3_9EURY|nr:MULTISPECIES: ABC transporter ATP-binding protein [Halococcus]EMA55545.1 ABC transporter [Halococcus salifodinae DSM 8989]
MVAIRTNELTKYYGETLGIEDLTLDVREGEVFGFLGPNGAGKSTTIRTLMGFQSPSGGSATVLGHDVTDRSAMIEAKQSIGYIPAEMGFDESVTGRRFLRYQASLKGDTRSEELLELFDPPMDREIGEYSTGNKRKLAVVLAFMHDPDLVIMDEPTSGLDPLMQERFYEFIREEQEQGVTFFFSSHILSEVQKICDRVGVIRNGQLVELEDVETLLDRTGKRVSAHVAGTIEPGAFDIDGAHDVTISGDEESSRPTAADGGERDPRRSAERSDGDGNRTNGAPADAEQEPGEDDAGEGSAAGGREGTTVSFTYTGDYNALLEHLVEYDILDLDVADAPLEDVFMRFYGDVDPDEESSTVGRSDRRGEADV